MRFLKWLWTKKQVIKPEETPPVQVQEEEKTPVPLTLSQRLMRIDVDSALQDPVFKRMVFISHSLDIGYMLDALYVGYKLSSTRCAISLYDFFNVTRLPPQVCIERICAKIEYTEPKGAVKEDLVNLLEALETVVSLGNIAELNQGAGHEGRSI